MLVWLVATFAVSKTSVIGSAAGLFSATRKKSLDSHVHKYSPFFQRGFFRVGVFVR
jgi:hypothetical protein